MKWVTLTEDVRCNGDSGATAVIPHGIYESETGLFDSGPERDELEILAKAPQDSRPFFWYVPASAREIVRGPHA